MSKQHTIALGDLTFVPDMSGALLLADEKMLLVADLHLEQGASLARRGVHVPPYDTTVTLEMLERVLQATAAEKLVLLGDSFHDGVAHDEIREEDAIRLLAITSRIETIWITGNHDPHVHTKLGGSCVEALALSGVTLRHIPQRLNEGELEIAGHLHPGASIVQRGHHIRTKCMVADHRRIIVPAFGSYTGAMNIKSQAFAGLLDPAQTKAWMIGKAAIHCFPYQRLA